MLWLFLFYPPPYSEKYYAMPYEMLNNIIDIYKYIYVMDVYNREVFSNLHISCVLHDCQFWI